ncbi:hypothetical protein O181_049005, partial [Austropuccinia psidii MF-1]|nr:hypothetical protein [Austropuccinia psidii MF-1]
TILQQQQSSFDDHGPPEIEAFQCLSLFMKDISIVTGHLSKMMTSNYSFNYSTSCRWGRKPTTWSEAWSRNNITNSSSNTAYNTAFKPFVPDPDINRQSHFTYESGSPQNSSAPLRITTSISTKKNFSREGYSINFDSQKFKAKTMEKDKNPTTKTTISNDNRPLSCNQPETSNNEIYNIKEEKSQPTTSSASSRINKIELATIDTTINKNEEETILN